VGRGCGERGKGKGREGLSECGKASCTRSSRALSIRHAERLEFASRARVLPIDNSLARNLKFSHNFPPESAAKFISATSSRKARGGTNFAPRRRSTHNRLFYFLAFTKAGIYT